MEKKGVSHIEVILSILLFISAVSAIIYTFQPFSSEKAEDTSLSYIVNQIERNITVDLLSYSVKINEDEPMIVSLGDEGIGKYAKVESYEGIEINSSKDKNSREIYFNPNGADFVVIYLSEDFSPNDDMPSTGSEGYNISSLITRQVLSEKRVSALKEDYDSNYEELKKQLGLTENIDFSFEFSADGRQIVAQRNPPRGLAVYATKKRAEIISTDNYITFGDLSVVAW